MTLDFQPVSTASETNHFVARLNLGARVAIIGALLFVEKFLLNFLVDFDAAQAATGASALFRGLQHWTVRFAVTLVVALALFGYVHQSEVLVRINGAAREARIRLPWLILHGALLILLAALSYILYGDHAQIPFELRAPLYLAVGLTTVAALAVAMAPWSLWRRAAGAFGVLWVYALSAATVATCAMQLSQRLWTVTAGITFDLVRWILSPYIPELQVDSSRLILATNHFAVQVTDYCSGLEGMGLMLAFCCTWLIYFRREYRFPRALILIPGGLLLAFVLNAVRIAVLMLIGNAGLTDLAVNGFHSQAGWITFNCAAGSIVVLSRRSAWLQHPAIRAAVVSAENAAAAYLMPFLILLGGRMIVLAVWGSSGPWYVLPAFAGALALWHYRKRFATLDWRFSWRGAALGLVVFLLWMLAARWLLPADATRGTVGAAAQQWSTLSVVARVIGSIVIVPLAEELAYRGYLLRRLAAPDFAEVRFERVGFWPVLVSAVVFGAAHGSMWPPGVLAGIAYGLLVTRTGRFGETFCAHAVTNGLIAIAVVVGNHWELWS